METIRLNQFNTSFRIHGSVETRSLELKSISIVKWPETGRSLKVLVFDEKDVPIYRHVIAPVRDAASNIIEIDKKFVFYDHLTVQVTAEPVESAFAVEVNFA